MRNSPIQELMLNVIKQGHNAAKATKNICYAKCKRCSYLQENNQMVQEILLEDQAKSNRPKTIDFKIVLQIIVTLREYQASSASHSPVWFVTYTTTEESKSCQIVLHIIKILRLGD